MQYWVAEVTYYEQSAFLSKNSTIYIHDLELMIVMGAAHSFVEPQYLTSWLLDR